MADVKYRSRVSNFFLNLIGWELISAVCKALIFLFFLEFRRSGEFQFDANGNSLDRSFRLKYAAIVSGKPQESFYSFLTCTDRKENVDCKPAYA